MKAYLAYHLDSSKKKKNKELILVILSFIWSKKGFGKLIDDVHTCMID